MPAPGESAPTVRGRSLQLIEQAIRDRPGITRPELAALIGLSRTAVAQLAGQLIQQGRVVHQSPTPGGPGTGSGRPAGRLEAAPSRVPVGALDFGHNHVWAAVGHSGGEILADELIRIDVDQNAADALDRAADALRSLQEQSGVGPLGAVVAGIPGPVDSRNGLVQSPTILSGWVGTSPSEELQDRLGTRVAIENDAVLGARGELRRGAGLGYRDFLYIKASHGVGASIVINGRPYRGSTGLAGEIGHTQLPNNSELCRCGNRGCLEAVVSVRSVRRQLAHTHPQLNAEQVELSDLSDAISGRVLGEAGRTIGRVLADLCNLFNPAAVIIGGELGASGPALIAGVRESILRFAQPATASVIDVRAAELGVRAELVGALETAAELTADRPVG